MSKLKKILLRFFGLPEHNELATFLICVAFLYQLLRHREVFRDIMGFVEGGDFRSFLGIGFFCLGTFCSAYHIFVDKKKTDLDKYFMLFFVVTLNIWVGIRSGLYVLAEEHGWKMVFPVWNIASAVMLMIVYRLDLLQPDLITDEDANARQVMISVTGLAAIILFMDIVFQEYWAITLSACLAYAVHGSRQYLRLWGLSTVPSKH